MGTLFKFLNRGNITVGVVAEAIVTNTLATTQTTITGIYIHNPDTVVRTVTLYIVPTGSTAIDTTQVWEEEVGVDETLTINDIPILLEGAGDVLYAKCSSADACNVFVFGAVTTL